MTPGGSSPGPDSIRLRRDLSVDAGAPVWPTGFTMRTLRPEDARPLHALLAEALDETLPFEEWWEKRSGDPEFDADLWFLVHDPAGRPAAAALSWTAAFLKDLVVHPSARRLGIGEALMKQVFATFRARGADHVDLKTNLVENADAVRLYRRLGMVEVDWAG